MESEIRPLTVVSDTSVDQSPFKETRAQIARTERTCETLRQGIGTMQRGLAVLADIVGGINDCEAREKLQRQLDFMNEVLLLRLDQLGSIDRLLQITLDRARSQG